MNITTNQLQAALLTATEILKGDVSETELVDRLEHHCDRQSAEHRLELIEVVNLLVQFGLSIPKQRDIARS